MQSFKRADGNFMYSGIFTQVFITFFFQDLHLMYHIRNLHLNTYEFSISILFLIIALRIKPSVFLREKQVWYYEGSPPTVKRWVLALQHYPLPYTYNAFQNLVASEIYSARFLFTYTTIIILVSFSASHGTLLSSHICTVVCLFCFLFWWLA